MVRWSNKVKTDKKIPFISCYDAHINNIQNIKYRHCVLYTNTTELVENKWILINVRYWHLELQISNKFHIYIYNYQNYVNQIRFHCTTSFSCIQKKFVLTKV